MAWEQPMAQGDKSLGRTVREGEVGVQKMEIKYDIRTDKNTIDDNQHMTYLVNQQVQNH